MSKRTVIYCLSSILLIVYLFVAVSVSRTAVSQAPLNGVDIEVNDTLNSGFITAEDVNIAAGDIIAMFDKQPRGKINTFDLENRLRLLPNIESARCVILNNGVLRIDVVPMIPVARIFPDNAPSYYVNAEGKHIPANSKARIDVPVISGHITANTDIRSLLPMLAKIKGDSELDAWASSVTLSPRGDIIIIPAVLGHVVVMGDTADMASKFERVRRFYHEVIPYKGWNYYDSISVKWRGRIVATRRQKKSVEKIPLTQLDGVIDETLPDETMLDDNKTSSKSANDSIVQTNTKPHAQQ